MPTSPTPDADTGETVRGLNDISAVGDTKTVHVQGYRDGGQVRGVVREIAYTLGTAVPKCVPDEGAEVYDFAQLLNEAE